MTAAALALAAIVWALPGLLKRRPILCLYIVGAIWVVSTWGF